MHGTRNWLPNKVDFLKTMSLKLKADIVALAYRGFSHSDPVSPDEAGIMRDIDAM